LISLEVFILVIFPSACACLSIKLSPFITKINSKGDKGQPCQIPRPLQKKGEGPPFTKTTKEVVLTQLIIQFLIKRLSPILNSIIRRKSQFTQAYTFSRSNFKIRAFIFFVLMLCKNSWLVPTKSKIFLPFRNPSCSTDKVFERNGSSLFARDLR